MERLVALANENLIPAALAGMVRFFRGLDDFEPDPHEPGKRGGRCDLIRERGEGLRALEAHERGAQMLHAGALDAHEAMGLVALVYLESPANPTNAFIELYNGGPRAVDVSNWTLTEHATQREFVYTHKWRVGDLVMWDNRQTMHRARPFPEHEPRDVRRTTLQGDGPTTAQVAA